MSSLINFMEADISAVSLVSLSSGSKVLLDLTDREKYVIMYIFLNESQSGTFVACETITAPISASFGFVYRGETALHKAASEKQHAVCRLLVEAGASLEKTNFQVNSP